MRRTPAVVFALVAALGVVRLAAAQSVPGQSAASALRFLVPAADSTQPPVPIDPSAIPWLRRPIALDLHGVTIQAALIAIARSAGLQFAYATDAVPMGGTVTLRGDSIEVRDALKAALGDARVDVLLKPRETVVFVPRAVRHMGPSPPATSTIIGSVVDAATGASLPYGVVSLPDAQVERFTNADGRFVIPDLKAGPVKLRTKHIGYAPVDTLLALAPGETAHVQIALSKVVIQLPVVTSADAACGAQRTPRPADDSAFGVLFEQVRQNAERSRLLTRSYPFVSTVLEVRTQQAGPKALPDTEWVDTLRIRSQHDWRYAPGNMVIPHQVGGEPGPQLVLPELGDFADDAFIENHCFSYAGEQSDGFRRLIEVDFQPTERVTQPDIAGSLFFDPASFQIQRAQIRLTRPTRALLQILKSVTVEAKYGEIAPGIPVMVSYSSVTDLPAFTYAGSRNGWTTSATASRLLGIEWLNGRP